MQRSGSICWCGEWKESFLKEKVKQQQSRVKFKLLVGDSKVVTEISRFNQTFTGEQSRVSKLQRDCYVLMNQNNVGIVGMIKRKEGISGWLKIKKVNLKEKTLRGFMSRIVMTNWDDCGIVIRHLIDEGKEIVDRIEHLVTSPSKINIVFGYELKGETPLKVEVLRNSPSTSLKKTCILVLSSTLWIICANFYKQKETFGNSERSYKFKYFAKPPSKRLCCCFFDLIKYTLDYLCQF